VHPINIPTRNIVCNSALSVQCFWSGSRTRARKPPKHQICVNTPAFPLPDRNPRAKSTLGPRSPSDSILFFLRFFSLSLFLSLFLFLFLFLFLSLSLQMPDVFLSCLSLSLSFSVFLLFFLFFLSFSLFSFLSFSSILYRC
jgi:hypothetical protein